MRITIGGVALIAFGAVSMWAVMMVFLPPTELPSTERFTTIELTEGEVESSLSLNVSAQWVESPVGSNQANGVVTSVNADPGSPVSAGAVLYSVNLRPVVIGEGQTPAFRSLAKGASGADVEQFQTLLKAVGLYRGAADGIYGDATEKATKAWQKMHNLQEDGVLEASDVIFVPHLPARVSLDPEFVVRGNTLVGGEPILSVLADEPEFTIPVTAEQANAIPTGTRVEISAGERMWIAKVADRRMDPATDTGSEQTILTLTGEDSSNICGAECAQLGVRGQSFLPSRLITQAAVSGVVAPSSALVSLPDGTVQVIDEDGAGHDVKVLATAKGMSVIEGVEAGESVRIPGATVDDSK